MAGDGGQRGVARAADLNIDSLYLNSARSYRRVDISNAGIGRDNEKRNGGDRANRPWIAAEREKRRWEMRQHGRRASQDRREMQPAAEWNL